MISNYREYKLSKKEYAIFCSSGYAILFFTGYLFYHSLLISIAMGFAVVKCRPLCEGYLASRRMDRLVLQFKDLLYSLSASIASGRHMGEALAEAVVNLSVMYKEDDLIMVELNHMNKAIRENNASDMEVLADFARRCRQDDIDNFVRVFAICRTTGADLEKVIANTCEIITDKMNIEREIKAITSQKKVEGRFIASMPLIVLLGLNAVAYDYVSPLYTSLPGKFIMTVCLAAIIAGVYLIEKISNVEI